VAQRRAKGFRIHAIAWHSWEGHRVPGRLETTLDALFAMSDEDVVLIQPNLTLPIWQLFGRVRGQTMVVLGSRDRTGAWVEVLAVHPANMPG
jgi:hypothetical protein